MRMAWLGGLLVGMAACGAVAAQPWPSVPEGAQLSGRLIVRAKTDFAGRGLAGAAAHLAGNIVRSYPEVAEWVVRVPAGQTEAEYAGRLMATGAFEYAHPDWLVKQVFVPNDPQYPGQWHLPRMRLPAAWDLTTGSPTVVVAFCDSGADLAHPDLAGVLVSGYNSVDNLAQAQGGNVSATNDHGTEVAGCIGAIGNNGVGVAGMGWNLGVMPIRVTNLASGSALLSEINEGARWAADHGARVVNISYSGVSSATNAATGRYLRDSGCSCVWAAGNASTIAGPLDISELVVVGATDQNDALAAFSNYGAAVDVVAPGVAVLTTNVGGYAAPDGTSFAAPLTAGLLALTRSANPGWGPAESELALVRTARDLGTPGRDDTFARGLIDAGAAVALAHDALTVPMPPVTEDDLVTVFSGATVDVDVLGNDADFNGGPIGISGVDPAFPGGWAEVVRGAGPQGRDVLRITADAGFRGTAQVSYTARDPGGLTGVGRVELRVVPPIAWAPPLRIAAPSVFGEIRRIRAADFDGDGDLDLALGQISTVSSVSFLRNDGGVFTFAGSVDLPTSGDSFDAVDLNHDGRPDLISGALVPGQISVSLATGPFTFAPPTTLAAAGFGDLTATTESGAPLDVNGDGRPDVAYTTTTPTGVYVRLGDGLGGFGAPRQYSIGISPVLIRAEDVTGDGRADLIVGSTGGQTVGVLVGNADGVFTTARNNALGVDPQDVRVLDADGDGAAEIVALCSGQLGQPAGLSILKHLGGAGGAFTLTARIGAEGDAPWGMAVGDFNRDGRADVSVINMLSLTRSLYPGAGPAGLGAGMGPAPTTLLQLSSVRAADLDGDGAMDLVCAGRVLSGVSLYGGAEILLNRTPRFCPADFSSDGFLDFLDFAAFVECFGGGACPHARSADFNFDGFVDFFDFDAFLDAFERGC